MTKNIILKLCRCVLHTFTVHIHLCSAVRLAKPKLLHGQQCKTYIVNVGATTNSAIVCFIVGVAVALCRT